MFALPLCTTQVDLIFERNGCFQVYFVGGIFHMGLMFCRLLTISNHQRKSTGTIEVLDVSSDIHMHVPFPNYA